VFDTQATAVATQVLGEHFQRSASASTSNAHSSVEPFDPKTKRVKVDAGSFTGHGTSAVRSLGSAVPLLFLLLLVEIVILGRRFKGRLARRMPVVTTTSLGYAHRWA
jgi:hypothetical protein